VRSPLRDGRLQCRRWLARGAWPTLAASTITLAIAPRASYDHATGQGFLLDGATMSTNPFEPPQYNFNQPPQRQYSNYAPQQPPQNNMAVGSLVCGALGLMMLLCCGPISLPLCIAAIAMGAMSLHPPNKGLAIGGIVCGIIGVVLSLGLFVLWVILVAVEANSHGQSSFAPQLVWST
jgi:hypothetical protein